MCIHKSLPQREIVPTQSLAMNCKGHTPSPEKGFLNEKNRLQSENCQVKKEKKRKWYVTVAE